MTPTRTAPARLLLGLSGLAVLLAVAPLSAAPAAAAKAAPAAPAAGVAALRYPALPAFEIPQPERVVLGNGLVVMLLEDHELPLIDATALVRTGSRLDPAGKAGLAKLAGAVLRTGGTARMTGDQLDDYLEGKAAVVESTIDDDSGRVNLSVLKEDFPEVLPVFADILRHPAFADDKLAVARNQARAGVARQNDNPQGILFREFVKVAYGAESPYAQTESYASLAAIGRDDIVAWHRVQFQPERIVLGVVGDFDRAAVLKQIEAAFGDWPRGAGSADPEAPYRQEPAPGVYYVEKDDINQSNIAIGELGILRKNPDYYALEVMNQVLSGGFGSRLVANVRTKKGLAYIVFGQVGSDWDHPGMTTLFMTTKTATTGAGIDAMLAEARGMVSEPPTPAEVAKAKQAILNSFIFNIDSKRKVLDQTLILELYGYPLDWMSRYRRGIEAVTVDEVRAAAVRYLKPERFSILVVGPKEGTDRPLSTWGPVTTLDIAIPPPAPKAGTP